MSTHGTDQYLGPALPLHRSSAKAITALLTSGAIVLGQFIGFLFIGVLLFSFYHPFTEAGYATATSTAFPFAGGDRVFRTSSRRHMPSGLSGLVVAAIFAAAMSSSLNSIAATARQRSLQTFSLKQARQALPEGLAHPDFGLGCRADSGGLTRASSKSISPRSGTLDSFTDQWTSARVSFWSARSCGGVSEPPALIGMGTSIAVMLYIFFATKIAWTWYVFIGSSITLIVAGHRQLCFCARSQQQAG